jgi:hypothetical protein
VRLSVIAASVSSWPWMRIDTRWLVPWVVSVRFAENGPLDATAWINSPKARPTAVPAIPRAAANLANRIRALGYQVGIRQAA